MEGALREGESNRNGTSPREEMNRCEGNRVNRPDREETMVIKERKRCRQRRLSSELRRDSGWV